MAQPAARVKRLSKKLLVFSFGEQYLSKIAYLHTSEWTRKSEAKEKEK